MLGSFKQGELDASAPAIEAPTKRRGGFEHINRESLAKRRDSPLGRCHFDIPKISVSLVYSEFHETVRLQSIDISNLIPDLIEMDDRLHRLLKHSLETFLKPGGMPDTA